MSEPALALSPMLRIAIVSADPARRARLAAIVMERGHAIVQDLGTADAVLADSEFEGNGHVPIVALGGADSGAAGVLASDADASQIDAALRAVANGLRVRPVEQGFDQLVEESLDALLTPREIEVLSAVGEGLGNKAIARKLDISLHTVKFHLEAIFRKLGVRSRAEAVAKGLTRVNL
jgi:DNA-binding CsgD family transcriptional regulator